MKALPTEFTHNDLRYRIIERAATRYFAELRTTDTGVIIAYETGRILQSKAREGTFARKVVKFEAAEHLPGNEAFGFDKFECAMPPKDKALVYADYLAGQKYDVEKAKILPKEVKSHCGNREKEKVMLFYHQSEINFAAQ